MMSLADSTADSTPDLACSTTPLATRPIRLATERARFAIVPAAFVIAPLRAVERFRVLDFRGEDFFAEDFFAGDLRAGDLRAEDLRAEDFRAEDLRPDDFRADDFEALFFRAGPRELDFRAPPLFRADLVPRDADFREEDLRAGPLRPPDLRPAPPLFLAFFEPPRDDFLAAAIFPSSDVGVLLRHYSNFRAQKTTAVLIRALPAPYVGEAKVADMRFSLR